VSTNPVAYISKVPKEIQRAKGIGPDNAKQRTDKELVQGVREWIEKKFCHPKKEELRQRLFPGNWSRELVVNAVKHPREIDFFRKAGIKIIQFKEIVSEMQSARAVIEAAAGNDLLLLMHLGKQ
jgi:hypothetical protein